MTIADLNWNVLEKVCDHAFKMIRPCPHPRWGRYYRSGDHYRWENYCRYEPLLNVALTCREWSEFVRQLLAREEWIKWAYLQSLRLVYHWQHVSCKAFIRLSPDPELNIVDDRVGDLNAVDVPGTAAYFASAIFNLTGSATAYDRTTRWHTRFQIRDEEAMDTFLVLLEHDMVQLMERALLVKMMNHCGDQGDTYLDKPTIQARELRGALCSNVNPSPQPPSAFLGSLVSNDPDVPLPTLTAPDVGVSLDSQLRIVSALARRAGIPKFDADFTKLAWWILLNRARQLIDFASMIAASGLSPDDNATQFDDDELPDSAHINDSLDYDSNDDSGDDRDYDTEDCDESDSGSYSGYGTNNDSEDEDAENTAPKKGKLPSRDMVEVVKERAAKRRRTCRFDPVLHDGENIPVEWHFRVHHYVISPSPKCFRWAYERM